MVKKDTIHLLEKQDSDPNHSLPTKAESDEQHLLIIEDDQGRKEFPLEESFYSIGRNTDCDIRLISQFVSRHHATLIRVPKQDSSENYYYQIIDGDLQGKHSANGLLINGHKMSGHKLKNEDEFVFGPQVRAIYYLLKKCEYLGHTDASEYDITLINPAANEN